MQCIILGVIYASQVSYNDGLDHDINDMENVNKLNVHGHALLLIKATMITIRYRKTLNPNERNL